MVRLKNIHKYYGAGAQSLHVLKGVDLSVHEGELVSIVGSSGSGKSTLLNILGLLDRFDEGEYQLADKLIGKLSEAQAAAIRNRHIGFVFQSFNLLNFKNAVENVALPLYYQNVSRKKRNAKALELLERFGLRDRAYHMPSELSGGQKQRVAIARALVTDPKVILADEPTGALDSVTTEEVMNIFKELHASGKTIIIITHEREVAEQAQRIITLKDGLVVSEMDSETYKMTQDEVA